jgi:hypothetical protein
MLCVLYAFLYLIAWSQRTETTPRYAVIVGLFSPCIRSLLTLHLFCFSPDLRPVPFFDIPKVGRREQREPGIHTHTHTHMCVCVCRYIHIYILYNGENLQYVCVCVCVFMYLFVAENGENLQILHYEPTQEFKEHHEYDTPTPTQICASYIRKYAYHTLCVSLICDMRRRIHTKMRMIHTQVCI